MNDMDINALTRSVDFDAETHTYAVGGRRVPSVTKVIGTIQSWQGVPPHILEHARLRGQRVDDAINRHDDRTLDMDSVEGEIMSYVRAWIAFRRDTSCSVLFSQFRGYNQMHGYAGTLDKIVMFGDDPALIDIKATAKIEPEGALQTAAYAHLDEVRLLFPELRRFTLQLRPDANPPYKLHQWTEQSDIAVFLACLTVANWQANNVPR